MKLAFAFFLLSLPAVIMHDVDEESETCSAIQRNMAQISEAINRLCGTDLTTPAPTPEDPCPAEWEPMPLTRVGTINMMSTSTQSYIVPDSVPTTAKEILLYVYVIKGYSMDRFATMKIYTEASPTQYIKYLPIYTYSQNAVSMVSENMWFPATTNRRVYVSLSTALTGNVSGYVNIIGYR